jgi:dehydrogenase/reductase SDR family protein 1
MPTALVTGAPRGVGRGVAISLAEAGYTVFATGRTIAAATLPESVIRIPCDHTKAKETDAVFRQIAEEAGSLDLLVNSAWGGYERMVENGQFTWALPFWEQPAHHWQAMMEAGVHAAFDCSARAARMMIAARSGLIVNISFWAAQKHIGNAIYGIAKAATDKMSADMAHELRGYGVTVVSLYPGLVRTESVLEAAKGGFLDLSNSESPDYIGRVIAALAAEPDTLTRTGQVLVAAKLGNEFDLTDTDGRRPIPLSLDEV